MKTRFFIVGFTSVFDLNSNIKFKKPTAKFIEKGKNLQQQYWELTASHIRKQINAAKKEFR